MAVVIEELTSRFDVRDEAQLRKVVREEIRAALAEERRRTARGAWAVDPADPSAGGRPGEDGG